MKGGRVHEYSHASNADNAKNWFEKLPISKSSHDLTELCVCVWGGGVWRVVRYCFSQFARQAEDAFW